MTIAIVCNDSFGIINYRIRLAEHLQSESHEVVFICLRNQNLDDWKAHGFPVHAFCLDRISTNTIKERRALLTLGMTLAKIKLPYIFSFTIKAKLFAGIPSRLFLTPACPNITALGSNFSMTGLKSILLKKIHLSTLKGADTVVCQTLRVKRNC